MGKKLTRVTVLEKGIKSNVSSSRLKKSLEGAVVKAVWRDGKELFFQLKNEDEGNCQESAA
ncbi:MAG: DNA-formamidopyrimidine glycosylase family protein [Chitinophagaceae bacterium]